MASSIRRKKKEKSPYRDIIKAALDGRSQRWLSIKVGIPEVELSNGINGIRPFYQWQLDRINEALGTNLKVVK